MPIRLSTEEFARRRARIAKEMADRKLDALCLFSSTQVFYLTGFAFLATERPIGAVFVPEREHIALFVPLLEQEHAAEAEVDDVRTYVEYPDVVHPMTVFVELLKELGVANQRIGVDADGYGGGYGYVGPRLSELVEGEIVTSKNLIEQMMWIKSDEEVELIRESCRWGDLAHRYLQEYSVVESVETDVSVRASLRASMEMIDALGPEFRAARSGAFPARAGFRGQIGADSAVPHALTSNAVLQAGDVLVTCDPARPYVCGRRQTGSRLLRRARDRNDVAPSHGSWNRLRHARIAVPRHRRRYTNRARDGADCRAGHLHSWVRRVPSFRHGSCYD